MLTPPPPHPPDFTVGQPEHQGRKPHERRRRRRRSPRSCTRPRWELNPELQGFNPAPGNRSSPGISTSPPRRWIFSSERPNAPTAAGLNSFHSPARPPARSLFRKRNANERLAGFFLIIVVVLLLLLLFLDRFVIWHLALVLLFHVLFCCLPPPLKKKTAKTSFFQVT